MSAEKLEITCIAIAVLLGAGLMGSLVLDQGQHVPVSPQAQFPGAGWGWSFDYNLGMQGLGNIQPANSKRQATSRTGVLELTLDKPLRIGAIEITYRGLAPRKKFQIDLISLAVDPEYSYPHEIGIADARKGFTLMDRRFKLLTAGRSFLRLQPVPSKNP